MLSVYLEEHRRRVRTTGSYNTRCLWRRLPERFLHQMVFSSASRCRILFLANAGRNGAPHGGRRLARFVRNRRRLTRRRRQRASTLAGQLGGATTHDARRARPCIENRGWTAHGARKGSRRRRNVTGSLAVRRLRIAVHHASGRSESKRSLKSWSGSNNIRCGLCQGRTGCSSRC
jgi:hypothetical protein